MSVDSENTCLWAYAIVITRVSPAVQTLLTLCAPSKAIQGHGNPKKKIPMLLENSETDTKKFVHRPRRNISTQWKHMFMGICHGHNTCFACYLDTFVFVNTTQDHTEPWESWYQKCTPLPRAYYHFVYLRWAPTTPKGLEDVITLCISMTPKVRLAQPWRAFLAYILPRLKHCLVCCPQALYTL